MSRDLVLLLTVALDLTQIQARILELLMRHSLTQTEELDAVTNGHVQPYIYRLRASLKLIDKELLIDTRHGIGYSLGVKARTIIKNRIDEYLALTAPTREPEPVGERDWLG